jgi:hypothetical protein
VSGGPGRRLLHLQHEAWVGHWGQMHGLPQLQRLGLGQVLVPQTLGGPDRLRVRCDKASGCQQDHTPDEVWTVCRQTAGDAIAERMSHEVHRGSRERLNHAGNIRSEVVEGESFQPSRALANASPIDGHDARPRLGESLREGGQIAYAVAPGWEQHLLWEESAVTSMEVYELVSPWRDTGLLDGGRALPRRGP